LLPATILFVCTGNICRSPLAEAVARQVLSAHFRVSDLSTVGLHVASAGTHGLTSHPATTKMQTVAAEIGLDLSGHRSAQLNSNMMQEASLIYAMETDQIAWLRSHHPDIPVALLGRTAIDDPYGSGLTEYRLARREIVAGVRLRTPAMIALGADMIRRRQGPLEHA